MSTARSNDRTQINRANSLQSTGPRTPEGKQKSARNALLHGLTGQIVVMPSEDLPVYQSHLKSFNDEYHPVGATEAHLVQAMADTSWRLNRVAALESNVLALGATSDDPLQNAISIAQALESQTKALSNLSMHSQRLSRQFERTVTQLRALQQTRRDQEKRDLNQLIDIQQMQKDKGLTYDPSEHGFVFSREQINAAVIARNRETQGESARMHRLRTAA